MNVEFDTISSLFLASVALAALYGAAFAAAAPSWPKTAIKVLAIATLAAIGALIGAPVAIVLGLALAALGNGLLSRPGDRAFLAGMVAFGAGHLAYLGTFLSAGAGLGLLAAVPVVGLALSTEWWLQPHTGHLRWPVRVYVGVIAAMAVAAFSLGPGYGVLQVGVVLFLLSDLLLGIERFVRAGRPAGKIVSLVLWTAYWAGQSLIMLGSLLMP